MSTSRAKKQQRRRAPTRLEVRDGVPRPDAIWAPFPLTEIGMAAGLGIFAAGFVTGAGAFFLIGAVVLAVVTTELCLREHLAGFRSHSLLLASLPITAVHIALVIVTPSWRGPFALAVDLALAGTLAWWLRKRFDVAQRRARIGTA